MPGQSRQRRAEDFHQARGLVRQLLTSGCGRNRQRDAECTEALLLARRRHRAPAAHEHIGAERRAQQVVFGRFAPSRVGDGVEQRLLIGRVRHAEGQQHRRPGEVELGRSEVFCDVGVVHRLPVAVEVLVLQIGRAGRGDLQADIAADLIRLGIEVHVFNQRSVAEILRMIAMLGAMVGCTAKV